MSCIYIHTAELSSKCDKKTSYKFDWNMDSKPSEAPHIEQGSATLLQLVLAITKFIQYTY